MQSEGPVIAYEVVVRSRADPTLVYSSFVFASKTIAEEYAHSARSAMIEAVLTETRVASRVRLD